MALTETELVEQLKNGDEQALAELFSRYRQRLERLLRFRLDPRLLGRVDADDVLQESYLAAVDRRRHYQENPPNSFFVWMRWIVLQTLVDLHRKHLGAQKRAADREQSLDRPHGGCSTSVSLAANLLGAFTSPSQAAMRAEMRTRLENALESMEPIDREVLALRHFEELTNQETAEVLGIQQKAASIRYVRAIRRLKEIMTAMSSPE